MSEKSAHATRPQPQHHAPSTKPEKKWEIHPIMIMLENMNIMLFFMPSIMPPPGPIMFKLCCGPGSFFRRNKPRTLSPLSPRYSNCNLLRVGYSNLSEVQIGKPSDRAR